SGTGRRKREKPPSRNWVEAHRRAPFVQRQSSAAGIAGTGRVNVRPSASKSPPSNPRLTSHRPRCSRTGTRGGRFMRVRLSVSIGLIGLSLVMGVLARPELLAGQPQAPIKIGFFYPDKGPLAQLGIDLRDGFLLYWSEVGNKSGGRPVELILETKGSNKPDEGLIKARKLVEH